MVLALTSLISMSASFALKQIGNYIRQYLDHQPSTEILIHTFVFSKLDYCNSLLYGLSDKDISHFSVVRTQLLSWLLRLQERGLHTVTPILHKLHWLTIQKPIISKIFLITYKQF